MPQPVRLSFGAFAVILAGAGVALVLHANIFPWQLGEETSVMLAGFLAYDLVLLAPFLAKFGTAHGGTLVSLTIYVAFLVYSGAIASYYLFTSSATRIRIDIIRGDNVLRRAPLPRPARPGGHRRARLGR